MGCGFCIRIVKCVPVLFITLTIFWSYYAYVYELCIGLVESIVEKTLLLVFFHWLFIMLLWSYQKTIFTDIARIPQQFKVSKEEQTRITTARNEEEQIKILREISKDLPLLNCTYSGCIRYCDRCQVIKPDRAHHCSVCGVCVLKMDHHCPWVNNCVNYSNYKFFLLFLGWALIYCLYVTFTMLSYFLEFWRGTIQTAGRFHLLFLFVVAIMFAFSLVSLFGYHVYLVLKNRTTLEAFRAPVFVNGGSDKSGFDLGAYKNFQEVFGTEKRYWFLPIQTSLGDGIRYQVRRGLLLEPC